MIYVRKIALAALTCILVCVPVFAQEEFEVDETQSAWPSPGLNELLEDYLAARGWVEGENRKKDGSTFFIAIGKGVIGAGRSDSNFVASRQLAFDKAMLDAKKKMLQFQEVELSAAIESFFSEPSEERQRAALDKRKREGLIIEAQTDVIAVAVQDEADDIGTPAAHAFADRYENLLRYEAAEKLKAAGFDPSKPVSAQDLQPIIQSESFKKQLSAVAQGRIVGMQAAKTIEFLPESRNGQIGVVTIQSARLQAIADSIYSSNPGLAPTGSPKKPISAQIPTNKDALVSHFGVQSKRNERGEYCLVAYGQSAPRTQSTRSMQAAEEKAKLAAQAYIRQFAGELGSVLENAEAAESIETYANNMQEYTLDDSYDEKIKTNAKAISISGVTNVKRWVHSHPLTGHAVAGSVLSWCPSSALYAKNLRESTANAPIAKTELGGASQERAGAAQSGQRILNSDQSGAYNSGSTDVDDDDF